MVPLSYWFARLMRRLTPQRAVDWMLDNGIILRAGPDTSIPAKTVSLYAAALARGKRDLADRTVVVIGYGGSLGVAVYLLEAGVRTVILQDPFAPRRKRQDSRLGSQLLMRYCRKSGASWIPDPERIIFFHRPLSELTARFPGSCDYVFSRSVLEHVRDVPEIVSACAIITKPGGVNVHIVDLRDHFFSHPFEMLCYSERTWTRWLNPSSHLNRLRWRDYELAWRAQFPNTMIEAIHSLPEKFRRAKPRIRREFLTGQDDIDSVAQLLIIAERI